MRFFDGVVVAWMIQKYRTSSIDRCSLNSASPTSVHIKLCKLYFCSFITRRISRFFCQNCYDISNDQRKYRRSLLVSSSGGRFCRVNFNRMVKKTGWVVNIFNKIYWILHQSSQNFGPFYWKSVWMELWRFQRKVLRLKFLFQQFYQFRKLLRMKSILWFGWRIEIIIKNIIIIERIEQQR